MVVVLRLHHYYLALTPVTQIGMNKLSGNVSLALTKTNTLHKQTHLYSHSNFSHSGESRKNKLKHKGSVVGHYFLLYLHSKSSHFAVEKRKCFVSLLFQAQLYYASLGTVFATPFTVKLCIVA